MRVLLGILTLAFLTLACSTTSASVPASTVTPLPSPTATPTPTSTPTPVPTPTISQEDREFMIEIMFQDIEDSMETITEFHVYCVGSDDAIAGKRSVDRLVADGNRKLGGLLYQVEQGEITPYSQQYYDVVEDASIDFRAAVITIEDHCLS